MAVVDPDVAMPASLLRPVHDRANALCEMTPWIDANIAITLHVASTGGATDRQRAT